MIVGVPDHHVLKDTAIGWMNLAWDIAIEEAKTFQDVEFLYNEIEQEHSVEVAKTGIAKYWNAKRLLLNNAVSLLQQSLEIALKAKIAEVSPFLLIAGDPRSWPKAKDGSTTRPVRITMGQNAVWRSGSVIAAKTSNRMKTPTAINRFCREPLKAGAVGARVPRWTT